MAHEVLVKAKDHKIDAVTVYHGNRAAIRRTFPVVLNVRVLVYTIVRAEC